MIISTTGKEIRQQYARHLATPSDILRNFGQSSHLRVAPWPDYLGIHFYDETKLRLSILPAQGG